MSVNEEFLKRRSLTRDEIALQIRCQLEANHRKNSWYSTTKLIYKLCIQRCDFCPRAGHQVVSRMTVNCMQNCCNKTVPIFIVPSDSGLDYLLCLALHNWLYPKWIQPYRSNIEYGQYIAKFFSLQHLPLDLTLTSLAAHVSEIHGRLCDQIASYHQTVRQCKLNGHWVPLHDLDDPESFVLQPLFRAITITLLGSDYNIRVKNIGNMPALVTITGIKDGLSEPVTFETIKDKAVEIISNTAVKVSLDVAIDLVLSLEKRELDFYGPQPDPVKSTINYFSLGGSRGYSYARQMYEMGWGDEPIIGPTSTWVDVEKYPGHTGDVAKEAERGYEEERSERFRVLCEISETRSSSPRFIARRRDSF